jgi:preprotein translocase subunit SecF
MAGVTGLIVAIGVTADSFIVYFERVRDEVRDGRTLRTAVDTGWKRAKRTILVADGVNFLGALVLYLLASSSVRGFAFTLGLTTLIDILIVFLFTHPIVSLLARRPFFADGHRGPGWTPSGWAPRPPATRAWPHFAGPTPRRDRREPGMSRFAQFGNDLYTGKRSIDFVGRAKLWYTMSAVGHALAVAGLLGVRLNLGIEFTGGSEFRVSNIAVSSTYESTAKDAVERVAPGTEAQRHQAGQPTPSASRPRSLTTPREQ